MNRLRNSEHLKYPVGNGNNKKKKKRQTRPKAGGPDSTILTPEPPGPRVQEQRRQKTDASLDLQGNFCLSLFFLLGDRVFMKNYFRITRTFPGHIWLLLVRKAPGGQSTLLCAVLLLQDTQNKTSLFREKVSKLVKLCKKKKPTVKSLLQDKRLLMISHNAPRPILTHPPRPPLVRECEECNDANAQ